MKKYIYISGILSANLMFLGAFAKVLHWPGGGFLLTLSVAIFCIIFLPFALYSSYQNNSPKRYKLLYIVSYVVFAFVFIGALFKVMHWPGAGWLLIIGIPLPLVLFLPVYLIQTRKDKKYSMVNFMGIMFGLTFITVFSAMLSINPTYSVLRGIENEFLNNEQMITTLTPESDEYSHSDIKIVKQKIINLQLLIIQIKKELLLASGNNPVVNQSTNLIYLDNKEFPYEVLYHHNNLPIELKNKIAGLQETLASSNIIDKDLKELSANLLNIDDKFELNSNTGKANEIISWEDHYFSNNNLVVILNILTRIERNAKFIEHELIASRN